MRVFANDQLMSRSKKMPILQINFKLNVSATEYRKICESMAQTIAAIPELVWKVWLLNEQEGEAGGIYLFQNEQSLDAYLSSPLITQIKSLPQLCEMSAKRFETMPEVTALTNGPLPTLTTT
jgi:Putative mono-oxygenase ydhR